MTKPPKLVTIKAITPQDLPAQTLPPKTTQQEDITKAGQRRINLIWEITQAAVAFSITWAFIYCAVNKIENTVLTNAFFIIVTLYFVRTNHQIIGGVSDKQTGR